jgi:hypothetical protein
MKKMDKLFIWGVLALLYYFKSGIDLSKDTYPWLSQLPFVVALLYCFFVYPFILIFLVNEDETKRK